MIYDKRTMGLRKIKMRLPHDGAQAISSDNVPALGGTSASSRLCR